MSPHLRTLIIYIGALGIIVGAVFLLLTSARGSSLSSASNDLQAETAQVANVSTANPDPVSLDRHL